MRAGREVAVPAPVRLEDVVDRGAAVAARGAWADSLGARLARVSLPDDVSVTFHLVGEGGGTWTVSRRRGHNDVVPIDANHPDCRVSCSVDDFRAVLSGALDARAAFLDGRLGVQGDVGLALRLQRVAR
jgi:predicted lipid carrier protein YhbT